MNIHEASDAIRMLYRDGESSDKEWKLALMQFNYALDGEHSAKELEKCVLEDINWELHVDGRLALLRKAKSLGASSHSFLLDYFGYIAAHFDPGPEQENARKQLELLLSSD